MLERPNVVITGGSKNIGKDIALYFAKTSSGRAGDKTPEVRNYPPANVAFGYGKNDQQDRTRNENLAARMREAGVDSVAIQGDITVRAEASRWVREVGEWATNLGGVNVFVSNAAGGLGKPEHGHLINNVAPTQIASELVPFLDNNPTLILMESSWSEAYPDLGGPPLDGYREGVSATKKEGEGNVIRVVEDLWAPIGGRVLILAAGIVEGSGIARLMKSVVPDFYEEQDKMDNVVSIKEVSEAAMRLAHDPTLPHGHVEVVGADLDELIARYPAEAA